MKFAGLVILVAMSTAAHAARWADSTDGVHTFLTFDSHIDPANITAASMKNVDFVWGDGGRVDAIHAANPDTVVSHYIPFARDPNRTLEKAPGLAWYQKHRPDFVLYKARKTFFGLCCFFFAWFSFIASLILHR